MPGGPLKQVGDHPLVVAVHSDAVVQHHRPRDRRNRRRHLTEMQKAAREKGRRRPFFSRKIPRWRRCQRNDSNLQGLGKNIAVRSVPKALPIGAIARPFRNRDADSTPCRCRGARVVTGRVAGGSAELRLVARRPLVSYDASGVWNPNVYRGIVGGADDRAGRRRLLGRLGNALRQDDVAGDRLGDHRRRRRGSGKVHLHARAAEREQNPCLWFQGGSNHSFPSGEASVSPRW